MEVFLVLQILFDAVILFGLLFLFHFSVHQIQKRKEEWDLLKDVQGQEIQENLQELLMTLKQLGKEVSDNIQEQVRLAEEKTEAFKKNVAKLHRDLSKVTALTEEVTNEKTHLEKKLDAIKTAKKKVPKAMDAYKGELLEGNLGADKMELQPLRDGDAAQPTAPVEQGTGFSSGIVREVYRLADAEIGLNEIVQKTELTRAEVQLILNLRENRFSTPN